MKQGLSVAGASHAFASRTMLNILRAGLAAMNGQTAGGAEAHFAEHIPLQLKQDFVRQVAAQYGLPALLRLGAAVGQFADTPCGHALLDGSSATSLLQKWQRLERYIHSHHYIAWQAVEGGVSLSHLSRGEQPPSLEEDLVVLGVLCALLQHLLGTPVALYAEAGGECLAQWPSGKLTSSPLTQRKRWLIRWDAGAVSSAGPDHARQLSASEQGDIVGRTLQAISAQAWLTVSLDQVARSLAMSGRSLQRSLQQRGQRFSHLLQQARVAEASRLLMQAEPCIAEIGFVCGFADQAHFSRVFRQQTGLSPGQYAAFRAVV